MNPIAYLRVSTDGQVDRYGLASQRADVTRWAKVHHHRVVHWCVDEGVSGTVDAWDRPGLACVLNGLQGGAANAVITPKLDRLARSLSVQEAALAYVWQLGGRLFTVETGEVVADDNSDPMRTAMRQMMGVFGQLERSMIVNRMQGGRAAKAASGGYAYGSPPFGFRSENGALVPDEREHRTLERIMELHADGLSTRQIADVLVEEGHRSKRGGDRFTSATIARIIKRATVAKA